MFRCSSKSDSNPLKPQKNDDGEEVPAKKIKIGSSNKGDMGDENEESISKDSEKEPAPPFYFNLHRHSPKGPKLLRVDTVIQFLHKAGYRASRTHFNREAVRTNASLSNLIKILTEAADVRVQ